MGKAKGESRGLEYLRRTRPKAMEHLLQFFAESARHLDPKTRFLISVVTKVIGNSPRGVAQYVKRSLQEGATPDEILDAVLCAYPCAGLTRVVDAIDVILDMDLPGFDALASRSTRESVAAPGQTESRPDQWHHAADLRDIPDVGGLLVKVGSKEIALFKDAGQLAAVDDECPHRGGSLSSGLAVDGEVTCPLHRWKFRLSDGGCTTQPRASVSRYQTRVEGDQVFVKI